ISELRDRYTAALELLLATAALVLLVACANLANLLLARAAARERELAVRMALGASRGRLVRQLMTESLLLAAIGAAGALLLARWLGELLVALLGGVLPLGPDLRVLGFTAAVAASTCVLFGLAPALRAARADVRLVVGLKAGGRDRQLLRRTLVVAQVALSFVLLVGPLLFARSLRNLTTEPPRFRDAGVVG